ncbi:MAG: preprotein translocase subunit SecG [Candidatus Vogelbacteria bacterium]|nr:preprotein translocase subunit SecG [Candidatus Vogelbacteria bacterium]
MQILGNILPWLQVILSVLLVAAILVQRSEEGLGSAFGGSAGGGIMHTKRGLEKILFISTIVLAILFVLTSILNLFI